MGADENAGELRDELLARMRAEAGSRFSKSVSKSADETAAPAADVSHFIRFTFMLPGSSAPNVSWVDLAQRTDGSGVGFAGDAAGRERERGNDRNHRDDALPIRHSENEALRQPGPRAMKRKQFVPAANQEHRRFDGFHYAGVIFDLCEKNYFGRDQETPRVKSAIGKIKFRQGWPKTMPRHARPERPLHQVAETGVGDKGRRAFGSRGHKTHPAHNAAGEDAKANPHAHVAPEATEKSAPKLNITVRPIQVGPKNDPI